LIIIMGLDDIIRKTVLIGCMGLASLSAETVSDYVDEEHGIEYFYDNSGRLLGYRDLDHPENFIHSRRNDNSAPRENRGTSQRPYLIQLANGIDESLDSRGYVSNHIFEMINNLYENSQVLDQITQEESLYYSFFALSSYLNNNTQNLENENLNPSAGLNYLVSNINSDNFSGRVQEMFMNAYSGAVNTLFTSAYENPREHEIYEEIISSYENVISVVGEEVFLDSFVVGNREHISILDALFGSYSRIETSNQQKKNNIYNKFLEIFRHP
jgi:hypothetical protein